jgi:hypothetical protein
MVPTAQTAAGNTTRRGNHGPPGIRNPAGRSQWTSPVQPLDLIDLDPAAKQAAQAYLPRFEFVLDDLADVDGRQLLSRGLTPAALITLLLLKTATDNNPASLPSCGGRPGSCAES